MRAVRIVLLGVLAAPLSATPGWADDRQMGSPLVLELVLNGRHTGEVGQFIERNGRLMALPADLDELGFRVPDKDGKDPISLSELQGVEAHINRLNQTLEVVAPDAALLPNQITTLHQPPAGPLSPAGWGLLMNYDAMVTHSGEIDTGGVFLKGRGLMPFGTLSSTELYQLQPPPGVPRTMRLESTFSYPDPDPDSMREWRVGDVVSGAMGWTRSVRLGGGQVATDFGMRPDLITYPLPVFSASAAVPSTVDLMINGTRSFSQQVQPGPFQMLSLPTVTGAGEAVVAVTNALGQQTLTTVPFYVTPQLLKTDLTSYSVEGGQVRRGFGFAADSYGGSAVSGSIRHGVTDWLTLEAHGEAASGIQLGGLGAVARIGTLGVMNVALAGSTGNTGDGFRLAGASTGYLATIGASRTTPDYSLSASVTATSQGYYDIAATEGTPVMRESLLANFGLPLGRFGYLGVTYIGQYPGSLKVASGSLPFYGIGLGALQSTQRVSEVMVSYSVPITRRIAFTATAFDDTQQGNQFGVLLGISIQLGGVSLSSSVSNQNQSMGGMFTAERAAVAPGDFGFRLSDMEGGFRQRTAEADYISPWASAQVGVEQDGNALATRAGAQGSLAMTGEGAFAGNEIHDSFAVAKVGDLPGVHVMNENRQAGTTDSSGLVLLPDLHSYGPNHISIDPDDVPVDYEAKHTDLVVRPRGQSVTKLDFGVRQSNSALLRLVLRDGKPVPIGSSLVIHGGEPVLVGYNGEAFVSDLQHENTADVALKDGQHCKVHFTFEHVSGDIPILGPLKCE